MPKKDGFEASKEILELQNNLSGEENKKECEIIVLTSFLDQLT